MENFWVTIAQNCCGPDRKCVLAYPVINEIPEAIRRSPIETIELNFRDRSIRNLMRIRQSLRTHDIGFIYFSDHPPTSIFYAILRLFGTKRIVIHDHTPGERQRPGKLHAVLKRIANNTPFIAVDLWIAVTDFVHRRHLEVAQVPSAKCALVPNGIHPIRLATADRQYAQKLFEISEDSIVIITTGRANKYKNIDFFIECANEIIHRRNQNRFHFLYCGDGPAMNDLRRLVDEYDIADHFTFAGNRSDVRQILPSCHVGFHAARGEVGYSLSILEYMSAGLVTVVPSGPSTSLATSNLIDGILYTPGDIHEACDAIQTVLDRSRSRQISNNAIEKIKGSYDIADTNTTLMKVLKPVFECE